METWTVDEYKRHLRRTGPQSSTRSPAKLEAWEGCTAHQQVFPCADCRAVLHAVVVETFPGSTLHLSHEVCTDNAPLTFAVAVLPERIGIALNWWGAKGAWEALTADWAIVHLAEGEWMTEVGREALQALLERVKKHVNG